MKEKYDKEKAIEAIRNYVYYIEDNNLDMDDMDKPDYQVFDAKRRALHLAVGEVFGLSENSYPSCKNVIAFSGWDSWDWENWKNGLAGTLEEYFEWKYYSIVDAINKFKAPYTEIKTDYSCKLRMESIIDQQEKKIAKRMKPIDEVMDEFQRNLEAWNKDHHDKNKDEPLIWDHSNRHDYNGYTGTIRSMVNKLKIFSNYPMEAYLKVATDAFVEKPCETIDANLKALEGIAFRAQERYKTEPFYKYLEKKKEEKEKKDA